MVTHQKVEHYSMGRSVRHDVACLCLGHIATQRKPRHLPNRAACAVQGLGYKKEFFCSLMPPRTGDLSKSVFEHLQLCTHQQVGLAEGPVGTM